MNLTSRNILNVFLASPGDLAEERHISRRVVDRINRIFGKRVDIHVELFGWEDTLPGAGRPQAIINQEVDSCDLFIGLLWKRWGQSTKIYSSGFEEEFSIAQKRYEGTASPEIWLFFKEVDQDSIDDPGEQLKQVLSFRDQQERDKKYLFKTFSDPEDWKDNFEEILIKYLLKISKSTDVLHITPKESLTPSIKNSRVPEITGSIKKGKSEIPQKKLLEALEKTIETVKKGGFGRKGEKAADMGEFEIVRLYLASAAQLSDRFTYEPLSVHGINLLYKHRKKIDLVPVEVLLLLRTIILSTHENVPGWYWFRNFKKSGLSALLGYIALRDPDETVRIRTIEFLTSNELLLYNSQSNYQKFFQAILSDPSQKVIKASLILIEKMGTLKDLPIIDAIVTDKKSEIYDNVIKSKMEIIIREKEDTALSEVLNTEFQNAIEKYTCVKKSVLAAKDDELMENINSTDDNIREAIVEELYSRDKLTLDNALKLLEDPHIPIRQIACSAVINKGGTISPTEIEELLTKKESAESTNALLGLGLSLSGVDKDKVILELFLKTPLPKLMKEVDWYSTKGPLAYRAIAIVHYHDESVQIESDLSNKFSYIREKAISKIKKDLGKSADKMIVNLKKSAKNQGKNIPTELFTQQFWKNANKAIVELQEVDEFILGNFTIAALAGIALNGDPSSIRFGRQYLNHENTLVKKEALKIIERFGDSSDIPALIDLAKNSQGDLKIKSSALALTFASTYNEAVIPLIKTEDIQLVAQSIKHIWKDDLRKTRPVLEPLLKNRNDEIRKKAISYFVDKMSRKKLEIMLNQNLERTTYYYNIIHWLDKAIYAPKIVKASLLKNLSEN
jgi:hypothetical protein